MTTVTAQNSFAQTSTGPTPGLPRTAASVNQTAAQQPMNNSLALANGYGTSRQVNFTATATTVASITEQFIHCDTVSATATTKNITFQFLNPGTDYSQHWKTVYFDRIDQGTVLTFQGGVAPSTFLTWTAPANYRGLVMVFQGAGSTVWELRSLKSESDGVYELDLSSGSAFAIADRPQTIRAYNPLSGTTTIDLDATYFRGETVVVSLDSVSKTSTVTIRDASNNSIASVNGRRDGSRCRIELRYHDSLGWDVLGVFRDNQAAQLYTTIGATTQTISTAQYEYFAITDSVESSITLTVPDGTFDGQRVYIMCDTVIEGGTVLISYTGQSAPTTLAMTGYLVGATRLARAFSAVWLGSRWHVTGYSLEI